ncbi:PEP-CTERM putative exosortase interaction domain-containing protein [Burkholderiales bacterium JOSHI_001]|nr:PEP-CTERM putative exosortase interaction domain-containing protein [Burkholderiales bacterium JOSHI_001]
MQVRREGLFSRWAAGAALASLAWSAHAVVPGQVETFSGASTTWSNGAGNIVPVQLMPSGGPGGTGDAFLQTSSSGGAGAGSRLVLLAPDSWDGDYLAASVGAISLDLNNLGSTDLSLRLLLEKDTLTRAVTTQFLLLPANSGWRSFQFSVLPQDLAGPAAAALAQVTQLRLIHAVDPVFPGPAITAVLGIDNVSAVAAIPEPASAWLLMGGMAGLVVLRRRNART